jgi:hypothetical protein
MRVDRITPAPALAALRTAPAETGFAALLDSAAGAAAAEAPQAAATAGAIVAAARHADTADRHARRHAKAMLQALAALQLAVLDGEEAEARAQLAALASLPAEADDPVLRLILREISARAAVELARGEA